MPQALDHNTGSPVVITSRLNSKAQATIPQPVRAALRLREGDELVYEIRGDVPSPHARTLLSGTPEYTWPNLSFRSAKDSRSLRMRSWSA